MYRSLLFATSCLSGVMASQVQAQTIASPDQSADVSAGAREPVSQDIIVTAQRQSQRLQDVPVAVSAFDQSALDRQHVFNPTALQQTLPNITFTKTNFTGSAFTIRGIGDLCVGTSCDSATGIHVNDMPLLGTRLFESDFFDLERIEVLRGPQGTLFGRNATSGVVNFITAKPKLDGYHAAGEIELGNYSTKRLRAMVNVPVTGTLGVRLAGTYLNHEGFIYNTFNSNRVDGRDQYALRGTISWSPDTATRVDLIGYYFHERDDRARIQKQLCHRDPTGILGCLPDKLADETTNGNAVLGNILSSRESIAASLGQAYTAYALGSVYGQDPYSGAASPSGVRTVREDQDPSYFADERQVTLKAFHDFDAVKLNFTGGYMKSRVDARNDLLSAVSNSLNNNPGLVALQAAAAVPGSPLARFASFVIPKGAGGGVCQSDATTQGSGVYGGNSIGCYPTDISYDRSLGFYREYTAEAHLDSQFDGIFNFLLGGIYLDHKARVSYFTSGAGLDYFAGLAGSARTSANGGTSFLGPPFTWSYSQLFHLKSYGVFGESYFKFSDSLKLTLGLRYNHDDKFVSSRNAATSILVPFGTPDINSLLEAGTVDFNPAIAGNQPFARGTVKFNRITGRAVLDYKITRDKLLYVSYARGYKSGGFNPPLSPIFSVPATFAPETVDAFEVGSKNSFASGALRVNLTGFYYRYKGLQLARVLNRATINDNINADIYGIEAETVISPARGLEINANLSFQRSKVVGSKLIADPRDPSGGRNDDVIIKDIATAANCAVVPRTAGNAAGANAFVTAVNATLGLQAPIPVPATQATGAYSICSVLTAQAAAIGNNFGGVDVLSPGPTVDVGGNKLPNAPTYKAAIGLQYTLDLPGGWTVVPRADINYTGSRYGRIFNKGIDRMRGYTIVNGQIQVNSPDDKFYVRAYVANLSNSSALTGEYQVDPSIGLGTNIFTVDPRTYGIAAGFKF